MEKDVHEQTENLNRRPGLYIDRGFKVSQALGDDVLTYLIGMDDKRTRYPLESTDVFWHPVPLLSDEYFTSGSAKNDVFVSALGALYRVSPIAVASLFCIENLEKGAIAVRLFFKSKWSLHTLETAIPFESERQALPEKGVRAFRYAHIASKTPFLYSPRFRVHAWVSVLEKDFAACYGAYKIFEAQMLAQEVLRTFTGSPIICEWLEKDSKDGMSLENRAWRLLRQSFFRGYPTFAVRAPKKVLEEGKVEQSVLEGDAKGLEERLVYGIIGMERFPLGGADGGMERVVVVACGLGTDQWKGKYKRDGEFYPKLPKSIRGLVEQSDAHFVMTIQEFAECMTQVLTAAWNGPKAPFYTYTFSSGWTDKTAGGRFDGAASGTEWTRNPQFCIVPKAPPEGTCLSDMSTDVWVELSQQDHIEDRSKLHNIGVIVLKTTDPQRRVTSIFQDIVVKASDFEHIRDTSVHFIAQPNHAYCVIPWTFERDQLGGFFIRVVSRFPIEVHQIPEDAPSILGVAVPDSKGDITIGSPTAEPPRKITLSGQRGRSGSNKTFGATAPFAARLCAVCGRACTGSYVQDKVTGRCVCSECEKTGQTACGACGKPVLPISPCREFAGKKYHPPCFRCYSCHQGFKDTQPTVTSSGQLVCQECNKPCSICGKMLAGEPVLMLDGGRVHKACLKCSACGEPLGAGEFVMAGDRRLHSKCFVCTGCKKQLSTEVPFAVSEDGEMFCETCASQE